MPHNSHFNRRHLILNIINHLGPISRTELINLTDYRPATVSSIIKELLEAELQAALNRGVFSSLSSHLDADRTITVEAIRKALDENDCMCMYYVKDVATRLGVVIANAVNLMDLTVSGGCISDSLKTILPLGAVAEICASYLRSDDYKWVYQLQPSDLEECSQIQSTI